MIIRCNHKLHVFRECSAKKTVSFDSRELITKARANGDIIESAAELRRSPACFEHTEYPSIIISASNGGYCVYYPANIFPQFKLGNIQSRDAFKPIASKRKHLMDYKKQ